MTVFAVVISAVTSNLSIKILIHAETQFLLEIWNIHWQEIFVFSFCLEYVVELLSIFGFWII